MRTGLNLLLSVGVWNAIALTPTTAQDMPTCLRDTPWGENVAPHRQKMEFELVEQRGDISIIGILFTPLSGEFAKVYGFFRHNGDCIDRGYVVGAFANANAFQQVDQITNDEEIRFNQDFYTLSSQQRVAITDRAPRYETIKPKAIELLR